MRADRHSVPPGASTGAVATVAGLWRYPVKSMRGEACRRVEINARGVQGDRTFAVRAADGKLGSGKNTQRFRMLEGLFRFHAAYRGDVPEVAFPDGRRLRADHPDIDLALSRVLGQSVTLTRASGAPHFDADALHLLTTASLAWLQALLPGAAVDARRFRPNLLLEAMGTVPIEQTWLGKTLAVGDAVRLRITAPTERCAMVTYAQAGLPEDADILRGIAQAADLQFGVYAEIVAPGAIRLGDGVRIVAGDGGPRGGI